MSRLIGPLASSTISRDGTANNVPERSLRQCGKVGVESHYRVDRNHRGSGPETQARPVLQCLCQVVSRGLEPEKRMDFVFGLGPGYLLESLIEAPSKRFVRGILQGGEPWFKMSPLQFSQGT